MVSAAKTGTADKKLPILAASASFPACDNKEIFFIRDSPISIIFHISMFHVIRDSDIRQLFNDRW
jgi:hypothetical protein